MITAALIGASATAGAVGMCWEGEEMPLTQAMRNEYSTRFATLTVLQSRKVEVEKIITRMLKSRDRYSYVSAITGVPWFVVGAIHQMECSGNFDCHLHNGNPLTARTFDVPAGRPVTAPASGHFPYTWEESAIDALCYDGFDAWRDWSPAGTLYKLEAYNGMGYRAKGIASPYLFGGTPFYVGGKYTKDHGFDPHAVSKQIGAAALLRRMADQYLIDFPVS